MKEQERLTASELAMCLGGEIMTPDGIGKLIGIPDSLVNTNIIKVHFGSNMVKTKNAIAYGYEDAPITNKLRNFGHYYLNREVLQNIHNENDILDLGGGCKLLLRPLSDMTEQEGIEILKLALGYDNLDGEVKFTKEDGGIRIQYFKHLRSKLIPTDIIEIDGNGNLVDEHGHFCNMVQIVDFYNQKGFDTRGWIESGKAIDKTKINDGK